jgi:hypothetical protein
LTEAERGIPPAAHLEDPVATAPPAVTPAAAESTKPAVTPIAPEVKPAPIQASAVAARALGSSTSTSPRESEESYDIVSDQAEGVKPSKAEEGSESDSDWE